MALSRLYVTICPSIHSFIQERVVESLLCARPCAGHRGRHNEQDTQGSCPPHPSAKKSPLHTFYVGPSASIFPQTQPGSVRFKAPILLLKYFLVSKSKLIHSGNFILDVTCISIGLCIRYLLQHHKSPPKLSSLR